MSTDTWLAYVATVLVLMVAPGPSHLLMVSNSLTNGFGRSVATAAGDLTANILQMLAAGFGLAAVLAASEYGFAVIKWAGIAYLVWLGARQVWRSFTASAATTRTLPASVPMLWLQGFVTSAANPKAVVFFAALFPQFIDAAGNFWMQMLVLGGTYVALDALFLAMYGISAGWIASRLRGPARAWLDRIAGGCLLGAAVALSFKSVQRT